MLCERGADKINTNLQGQGPDSIPAQANGLGLFAIMN